MTKESFFDIPDQSIKDGAFASVGAAIMFYTQRFFKNKDSLSLRVRNLESQHVRMEMQLNQINKTLKRLDNDMNDMRAYNKDAHHETRDLLTKKSIKDDIVDKVYKSLENIEKRLSGEKK